MGRLDWSWRTPLGDSLTHSLALQVAWGLSSLHMRLLRAAWASSRLQMMVVERGCQAPWLEPHPLSAWPSQAPLFLRETSGCLGSTSEAGHVPAPWWRWRLGSDLLASIAAFVGAGLCLMKKRILLTQKGNVKSRIMTVYCSNDKARP